jgi:DNA-binding NarL/FixJ family response regulator
MHNAEIARRLLLSMRTDDHHVAAILRRPGIHTRAEATADAIRLRVAAKDR